MYDTIEINPQFHKGWEIDIAFTAMPTEPVGFPQMGSGLQGGLQLVRDPTTGHILLIHAAGNAGMQF